VGDVDEGDADVAVADLALDALELDLHLLAQLQVERSQRLVQEQHARVHDQRPRERHALLLAAREHRGAVGVAPGEPHELECLAGFLVALLLRDLALL